MKKKVNKIAECNLVRDIINPPKCDKKFNIHYYRIKHRFINTKKVEQTFKTSELYWTGHVDLQL